MNTSLLSLYFINILRFSNRYVYYVMLLSFSDKNLTDSVFKICSRFSKKAFILMPLTLIVDWKNGPNTLRHLPSRSGLFFFYSLTLAKRNTEKWHCKFWFKEYLQFPLSLFLETLQLLLCENKTKQVTCSMINNT